MFRFYVTNLFTGSIQGTDSEQRAAAAALCEDFFVVDTKTGKWLTPDGEQEIAEME